MKRNSNQDNHDKLPICVFLIVLHNLGLTSMQFVLCCICCLYNGVLSHPGMSTLDCYFVYMQDDMKKDALFKIIKVLEEELEGPIGHLRRLIAPFIDAYTFFKDTIKNIKDGWTSLVTG